ncbi:MAG: hypothetical protein ABSG74_07980 [Candidatus Bathyarchaeia archaeon]|jgi:hypothetical protein
MLKRAAKMLKRTAILAAMIGVLGGLVALPVTYFLVWNPEIESARQQTEMLKEQNALLRQQIFIMNETVKLQTLQNQILQQSSLRTPIITINVYPAYQWRLVSDETGAIRFEKTVLVISWSKQTIFHVYVSNVGTGVAQVLYFTVAYMVEIANRTWTGNEPIQDLGGKILKPYDAMNFTYTFDPQRFFSSHRVLGTPMQFTFAVMSSETTSYFVLTVRLE